MHEAAAVVAFGEFVNAWDEVVTCHALTGDMDYLLHGTHAEKTYRHQVQGCMWVCGLEWWDILSYYPGMMGYRRFFRDCGVERKPPAWGSAVPKNTPDIRSTPA